MPNKKWMAALAVSSLICLAVLGLRTQAAAAGEGRTPATRSQGGGPVDPDDQDQSKVKGTITSPRRQAGFTCRARSPA